MQKLSSGIYAPATVAVGLYLSLDILRNKSLKIKQKYLKNSIRKMDVAVQHLSASVSAEKSKRHPLT